MDDRANRVIFELPDIAELNKTHTVFDLHFHTRFSDGVNTPRQVAKKARKLDIGIAITDHNAIAGALEMEAFTDVLSIPGIEVTSKEGAHLLVYFYEYKALMHFYNVEVVPFLGKEVMSSVMLTMEEIISRARKYEAVIIFPHPYCAMYTGVCNSMFTADRQKELLEMVDGVETINAGNLKKWNLQCALLGFNLNKAITGGSDGHSLYQMGKAVTYAPTPGDRTAFLDAVRAGQVRVMGKEIALIRKVASNGARLRTNLKNSPDIMEKNVRYSYALINRKSRQVKARMQRRLYNRRLRKNASH
ncbi:MAG: PHP domain-containing protein [Desulfobacterales bacterium]